MYMIIANEILDLFLQISCFSQKLCLFKFFSLIRFILKEHVVIFEEIFCYFFNINSFASKFHSYFLKFFVRFIIFSKLHYKFRLGKI